MAKKKTAAAAEPKASKKATAAPKAEPADLVITITKKTISVSKRDENGETVLFAIKGKPKRDAILGVVDEAFTTKLRKTLTVPFIK